MLCNTVIIITAYDDDVIIISNSNSPLFKGRIPGLNVRSIGHLLSVAASLLHSCRNVRRIDQINPFVHWLSLLSHALPEGSVPCKLSEASQKVPE